MDIKIQADSVNTGSGMKDGKLKGKDLFDVKEDPLITFLSRKIVQTGPDRGEWEGLIRQRVREEVYYREALALGLDKDDTIIRRRSQQKMEFVSDDVAAQAQPAEAELSGYLQAHPDSFRVEQKVTFRQVSLPHRREARR